jgi:enterochelin esterase-like enzyme
MKQKLKSIIIPVVACFLLVGCHKKIKQQEDEIYSRHLQEHIKLTIISTPMPDNKGDMNLLLLNDGQDVDQLRIKTITDSLYKKKLILPLLIVAIHAGNRMEDYGVGGYPDFKNNGSKADKYDAFISDELYDFAKKKAGVRKFNSIVIAGCSLGGLSAFDIAWNHADKIDKVGVFSGSFWYRDKDTTAADYTDDKDRMILSKIKSSRKRPKLTYWFYAGDKEETGDRDRDGIIDVVDDTKDLITIIKNKNVCPPGDIVFTETPEGKHDYFSWSKALPNFLLWAFGK